jgi:RNA polymerase sigma-70 factor, ECF subfamily
MWNDAPRRYTFFWKMGELEAEVVRYGGRVRAFALRHLRDEHAAADFAQEVLLTVLQALRAGRVERPERLGAFILGVCRMAMRDSKRSARRRDELLRRFGTDLLPEPPPAPSVDAARLQSCLEKLGEQDREVLVLTFYADKDAPEIAAELGLTPGNVRVTRHRAMMRLNDCVRGGEREAS